MNYEQTSASPTVRRPNAILIGLLLLLSVAVLLIGIFREDVARREYPKQYHAYVEKYAAAYELPPHLVYAVIHTESRFDCAARSSAGAMGLMQLMPQTFRWISDDMLGERLDDGMILDPETNIRYGCYYLRRLYDRYGDGAAALAAYNVGPGRVDQWLEDPALTLEDGTLNPAAIPYQETRRYVKAILNTAQRYDSLYPES